MNAGIIVDNEFTHDERVRREADILKEKYPVYVLCFDFGRAAHPLPEGMTVERIRIPRKIKNALFFLTNLLPVYEWFWARKTAAFIRRYDPGIIHTHDLYMARAVRSGIRKSGKKIPLILDLHEHYAAVAGSYSWTKGILRRAISRPSAWKRKEKKYLSCADHIIVLSKVFRDKLMQEHALENPDRFTVLPNIPDISRFDRYPRNIETGLPAGKPIFFYFGIIAQRRGIFTTLHAFKKIIQEGYDSFLLLIGPVDKSDRPSFFRQINDPVIAGHIIYKPWIDLSHLPSYLDSADICLAPFIKNPQHDSGVSNKIFQYMYGKKPIIASNCGPQQELLKKYECGLVFRNIDDMTAAMKKLLQDKGLRQRMGENGYRALVDDLNPDSIRETLWGLYERLEK
ncbi:MAG: glycosyltransferase family 4 protein [Bacteroidales bacterium]